MISSYIDELLQSLKSQESSETVFNLYGNNKSIHYHNLNIYLNLLSCIQIKSLFVDLSPGFKNCAVTGIPLTNEFILFSHQSGCPLFGCKYGYRKNIKRDNFSDISTALFWTDVNKMDKAPLLWYCYPFHCHLKSYTQTNREPARSELQVGIEYLIKIIEIYKPEKIYALGGIVSEHLNDFRIKNIQLIHPFFLRSEIMCGKWYSSN